MDDPLMRSSREGSPVPPPSVAPPSQQPAAPPQPQNTKKRRPTVIDLAEEEDREEAERIRREKRERLSSEAATLLKPLDYNGSVRLFTGHRLSKGVYESQGLLASIDRNTDEFWVLYEDDQNGEAPHSGLLRFDGDWNALETPKSLQRGVYFCQKRCAKLMKDNSESQATVFAENPVLLVPCSQRNLLYVVAYNVSVYDNISKQSVTHMNAVVVLSLDRDLKSVVRFSPPFPGTSAFEYGCATDDGTLHIMVQNNDDKEAHLISFDLSDDGLTLRQIPYLFCLTDYDGKAYMHTDAPNRWIARNWIARSAEGEHEELARQWVVHPQRKVYRVGNLTAHRQRLAWVFTTVFEDERLENWYQNEWFSVEYARGGVMRLVYGNIDGRDPDLYPETRSIIQGVDRLSKRGISVPPEIVVSFSAPDERLLLHVQHVGVMIPKRGQEDAPAQQRFFESNRVLFRTKKNSTTVNVEIPDVVLFGARGTRVVFYASGRLYESIHVASQAAIEEKHARMLAEQRVPLMARQLSWRMLQSLVLDDARETEIDTISRIVYDTGLSGWLGLRNIKHGSVIYAAFTNAPNEQNAKTHIVGLMMLFARPQSRGVFFQGPNASHAPTVFHPHDGLEVELLATLRQGSVGAGELLLTTAKVLAYRLGYSRLNLKALTQAVAFYIKLGMRTRYGEEHDLYLATLDAEMNPRNLTQVLPDARRYQEYGRWLAGLLTGKMPGPGYPGRVGDINGTNNKKLYPHESEYLVAMSYVTDARVQNLVAVLDPSPLKQAFPPAFYTPLARDPRSAFPVAPDVANLADAVESSLHVTARPNGAVDLF